MSVKIGNITFLNRNKRVDYSYNGIADIFISAKYAYIARGSGLSDVGVLKLDADGYFSGKPITSVNWESQGTASYMGNNSSPFARTVFTLNGEDYLIGWNNSSNIRVYKIDSEKYGLTFIKDIKAPVAFNTYTRAGWNGGNLVYFANCIQNILGGVYSYNIKTEEIKKVANINTNMCCSSFTGNSLYVDNDYVYMGTGSDSSGGFCNAHLKTTGLKVDGLDSGNIGSIGVPLLSGSNGTMSFSVYHKKAYYFYQSSTVIFIIDVDGFVNKQLVPIISTTSTNTSISLPLDSVKVKASDNLVIGLKAGILIDGTYSFSDEVFSEPLKLYENNLPTTPKFIVSPQGSVKVGSEVELAWEVSTDADNQKVTYEMDFFRENKWLRVALGYGDTKLTYTIPSMEDSTQAKFRLRAYDGKDYSESYSESNVFSVYNNTPPSNPSAFITPTSGQVVKPLQTVKVNWGNSVDVDEDDTVTYQLEFFNGSSWDILGYKLSNNVFNHLIPKMRGTKKAKYRVKAFDLKDFSEYTESNEFEILDVDLSTLATPNALKLDGVDDKISLSANPCTSFSKQLTIGFNKIKLEKSDSEYPIITKMCGEGKPSYAIYVTPEGHLKLSYSHASENNDSVETTIDCTGKWTIIEAFVDTVNGTMGIKLDGEIVASKDIPKGEDILIPQSAICYVGFDYSTQKYGKFLVSGIGLFSKNLSEEESKAFREVEPTGKEEGLVACYTLTEGGNGAILNDISPSKNEATMFGGIEWGFQFSVVADIKTPYPYLPQTAENLDYLRYKIDEFRHSNGLTPIEWTDNVLREDITPIKAVHWNEARKAIVEVYDRMGQKFANKITEEELRSTIQPHSTKYEIRNLPNVIDGIILGLKNK